MAIETTDWYPSSVKPVRAGVYELRYKDGSEMPYPYHYFCDGIWHAADDTPEGVDTAIRMHGKFEYLKGAMWRGVTKRCHDAGGRQK